MKKLLALALASTLALSVGCSSSSTDTAEETSAPAEATAAVQSTDTAEAEDLSWPDGQGITIICPWSAGGGSDVGVRLLQPYLEEALGTNITVINPTGGSGWVGWEQMLNADSDGLTISLVNFPTLIPGYMDPSYARSYSLDDFVFVANHVTDACVICINKDETRFTNMEEFVAYAQENETTFGTAGNGTDDHILMNLLNEKLGTKLVQVPSTGWTDNNAAIQGGHIDATAANIGECATTVASGDVIVITVFAEEESDLLSTSVPTFDSLGLCEDSIVLSSQRGYAVNADTDPAIVAIIEAALEDCITNPDHIAELAAMGLFADFQGTADWTATLNEQETTIYGMADTMGWVF